MMAFSFSSYSMTIDRNPTLFNEIKNPKVGYSRRKTKLLLCRQLFRLGGSSLRTSFECFSRGQEKQQMVQESEAEDERVSEFEALFSNLNRDTLRREPGIIYILVKCYFMF